MRRKSGTGTGIRYALITLMVFGFFLQGAERCFAKISEEEKNAAYDNMEVLTEALLLIKKHYVEEKTYEQIVQGALSGLLSSLDAHSSFLVPQAYGEMQVDTEGQFGGIGIRVGMRHGMLTVIAPIEDTPAFKKGVQAGDNIVEIDGVKTMGMSLRDTIEKLRGKVGEKVTIKIWRQGEEDKREIEIIRDVIEVPSIKGTRIIEDGVGYIRITNFSRTTAEDLQKALDTLHKQKMKALVLDLRNNPGGLLVSAIEVGEKFLKRGKVIVVTKGRGKEEKKRREAEGSYHYVDLQMAVLVNGGSASASEIVAGALQDHKRAVLLGSTTYGKASVQSVIPMQTGEGSAIRLTTGRYYTPAGKAIHNKGLDPDIPVPLTNKEWRDIQVRRAHLENPEFFNDEEMKEYKDVVDVPLRRAVDLLKALKIFKKDG